MQLSNKNKHKPNRLHTCPGNIRLFLGLFRTKEEQEKYLRKSLKRKLP